MKSFDDILNRNHRVELDKAWETSYTRRAIIACITYGVASFFMMRIGIGEPFLNALVPTGGYLLSTLSLSIVKKWWIERKESSSQSDFHEVEKRDVNDSEQALGGTERKESSSQSDFHEVEKRDVNDSEQALGGTEKYGE